MEGNEPWNFHSKIKTSASFLPEMGKPIQAIKNATTLTRKMAQSWSFIPLVLIVSVLSLKIANSE